MNKEAMPGVMLAKIVVLLAMVLVGVYVARAWVVTPQLPAALESDAKKAVFLNNGQVYFGDIEVANKDFLLIKNPYYLQSKTVLQEPLAEGQEPRQATQTSLTALGGEGLQLHQPEREMYVRWDTVLYMENMTDDAAVVRAMLSDPYLGGDGVPVDLVPGSNAAAPKDEQKEEKQAAPAEENKAEGGTEEVQQ